MVKSINESKIRAKEVFELSEAGARLPQGGRRPGQDPNVRFREPAFPFMEYGAGSGL